MRPARNVTIALIVALLLLTAAPAQPSAAQPRSNEPPWFNESGGCDAPAGMLAPMADIVDPDSYRGLPADAEVRGSWGNFFGRGLGDVQASLVLWTVPMSGGVKVWVHERALPAFAEVSRLLAIEQGKGHYYGARLVGTFSWRRVSGSFRMSHHSFGTTIDINWDTNPQLGSGPPPPRSEYTDMPVWYVTAWEKAGFCWGGDWHANKDPMHFSWKGPAATPGYDSVPSPFSPDTKVSTFKGADNTFDPGLGTTLADDSYLIADMSRDGAADVVRVRRIGQDLLGLGVAYASHDFKRCGTQEFRTPPMPFEPIDLGLANLTGDSRSDVWVAGSVDGEIELAVLDLSTPSSGWEAIDTGAKRKWVTQIHFADQDDDIYVDMFAIRHRGSDIRVRVFSGADGFEDEILDQVVPIDPGKRPLIDVADRGGDGIPDVLGVAPGAATIDVATGASGLEVVRKVGSGVASATTAAQFADWDGDGRDDLYAIGPDGSGQVFAGGTGVGKAKFWFLPTGWKCGHLTAPAKPYDFEGDSFADIVAGAPDEDLGAIVDAGAVLVASGGPKLNKGTGEMWSQATSGVRHEPETGDRFGKAFASGDFDGDGDADLAIGAPEEKLSGAKAAGLVSVLQGSMSGLTASGDQAWNQGSPKVVGIVEAGDRFGSALATGDFDGDGYHDLVVGSPGERLAGHVKAGVVNVFYGDRWKDLVPGGVLSQNTPGIPGQAEARDRFGAVLASGDFNGDGFDDVAVGSPTETVGVKTGAGTIHVIYGSTAGLAASTAVSFTAGSALDASHIQRGARFGDSLATGDVDGDADSDLVVGSPGLDDSGGVIVLEGTSAGIAAAEWPLLTQGPSSLGGSPDDGDAFGASVACADLNGDGFAEIVIGVPGETVEDKPGAGMVRIVPGAMDGPDTASAIAISQARPAIWNWPEPGDAFGASLIAADVDNDGAVDLIIGSPGEGIKGLAAAGMVVVVPGRVGGLLSLARSKPLYQGEGLGGVLETGDRTGS